MRGVSQRSLYRGLKLPAALTRCRILSHNLEGLCQQVNSEVANGFKFHVQYKSLCGLATIVTINMMSH
jgi:hypothetical protein